MDGVEEREKLRVDGCVGVTFSEGGASVLRVVPQWEDQVPGPYLNCKGWDELREVGHGEAGPGTQAVDNAQEYSG